ncbi:MAG: hypothetical protein V5B32_11825 [Candidatus Accumulibacter sp. UW26]|jgi:hypothetical protein
MSSHRLIYLVAHQIRAFSWQPGVLTAEGVFEASEGGKQRFAAYLAQHAKSIFSILANVAEEGFHIEMIPFLRGADRRAIITRKLGQIFFNATLTTSISLGHEKSQRKDERIMLAALTNNELFAPWLAAFARAEVALAGIYSLPLLGPALLGKLGIADERCLLLTLQDQSIRQSYLEKGALHFSRLTSLQNTSIDGIAQTFAGEARRLQQYLVSQRLIGRQQAIMAYLFAPADALAAIESSCVDSETLSFTLFDLDACARRCGLKNLPADSRCESVFLQLLATDRPRSQFASERQRHDYRLWVLRTALQGTGAVVMSGCLLWAGRQLYEAHQINQEVALIGAETRLANRRYEAIAKTFPAIPTSHDNLRQVINRYLELEKASTSPVSLWRAISAALQSAAAVEIDGIDWQVSATPATRPAGNGAAPGSEPPPVSSETALVRGTLRLGQDSNPRQVLAVFNRLLEALRRQPGLQVEVLQQPFDVESGKSLKGGDAALDGQQQRSFTVEIRRLIE